MRETIEIDFEGMASYEIECSVEMRGGARRIEIESAREIPERSGASEIELTPTVRALLQVEVERHFSDEKG